MNMVIETPRLIIRNLEESDKQFIVTLLNSPGWLKYIGDRHVRNEDDAVVYLHNGPMKSYRDHGFGLYLVALKETNAPVGMCGLLKRDYLPFPDIGFAMLPEHSGKGYGRESAAAIIDDFKNRFSFEKVMAITTPGNSVSQALLRSLGFAFLEQRIEPSKGEMLNVFVLSLQN
jgi:RimJ/RimL family protein N-acetyltransferase